MVDCDKKLVKGRSCVRMEEIGAREGKGREEREGETEPGGVVDDKHSWVVCWKRSEEIRLTKAIMRSHSEWITGRIDVREE